MYCFPGLWMCVCIYCDSPVAATGLIYMKIRTTIQGLEVRQMIGGFLSPSNSDGPTEKREKVMTQIGKGHTIGRGS